MKRIIYLSVGAILLVAILASCTSHDDTSGKSDNHAKTSESNHDDDTDKKKDDDQDKEKQDGQRDQNTDDHDKQADDSSNHNKTSDNDKKSHNDTTKSAKNLNQQLKMANKQIKKPTKFPVKGNVKAHIRKNTSSAYTIDYQAANKKIASFAGTHYKSADAAKAQLNKFMDGKDVPKNDTSKQSLGHGINGYGEGATGHAYFGWQEGKWTMNIASLTQDKMDNQGIAKKMVDFLEDHYLPAPKNKGIVSVDYPKGGKSVNVDIRWQEDDMIYQLKTSHVPNDALKMTTSVK